MKKYFIIILILAGMNFWVFGQTKKNIKQSDEIVYKLEIRELQRKVNKLQKENDSGSVWFLVLGPLFGIICGGLITYFIERGKNKSDEQQKIQDWFEEEVVNAFMECICYYEKLRIIVLSGKIKNNNLVEPLSALIKITYFTGIRRDINNFRIVLERRLNDLIKAAEEDKKEKTKDDCLNLQFDISVGLEEYCTHLYGLYNCLLSQTIKKKSDIKTLKNNGCKEEMEKFNE